jgi:hypothetical protein
MAKHSSLFSYVSVTVYNKTRGAKISIYLAIFFSMVLYLRVMPANVARSLHSSGGPERCFTQVGSGLTSKHWTRQERLARDKHSSLLRKSVNYGRNKFYDTGPQERIS